MNIFYASPEQVNGTLIELSGQEATHASKVLRHQPGDPITVIDGRGGWYEGTVSQITKNSVRMAVTSSLTKPRQDPRLILGLGIIKKRDRLEFAVEKAVELGVSEIALFRSEHTVREHVRLNRLQSIALSAMKQSLRAWLPDISVFDSLDQVLQKNEGIMPVAAHENTETGERVDAVMKKQKELLLLVGPEGGFSERETGLVLKSGGHLISLGRNRLRTETAAVAFLSQFI